MRVIHKDKIRDHIVNLTGKAKLGILTVEDIDGALGKIENMIDEATIDYGRFTLGYAGCTGQLPVDEELKA